MGSFANGLIRIVVRESMSAVARSARETKRQNRIALRKQAIDNARHEVESQDRYIQTMTSFHMDCSPKVCLNSMGDFAQPEKPIRKNDNELQASLAKDRYIPGFSVKLFKLTESMLKKLDHNVENAKLKDDLQYNKAMAEFSKKYDIWEKITKHIRAVLNGDNDACWSVVDNLNIWKDIKEIGTLQNIEMQAPDSVRATILIDMKHVPQDIKKCLASGKISFKKMPIIQYNEICLQYVCSSAIRVMRELFAALPVKIVQINVSVNQQNAATGNIENNLILSATAHDSDISDINWNVIDPISFIKQIEHQLNFKKSKGFSQIFNLKSNRMIRDTVQSDM